MIDINVKELFNIGLKYGFIISGLVGIVAIGIRYSLKFLQELI